MDVATVRINELRYTFYWFSREPVSCDNTSYLQTTKKKRADVCTSGIWGYMFI